jgi:hypothetical protein
MSTQSPKTAADRAVEAARLFREADRLRRKRPIDISEMSLNPHLANEAEERAHQLMARPQTLAGRATMEMVERPAPDTPNTPSRMEPFETLDKTNTVIVSASDQRAELSMRAGVLPLALDIAHSADAQGPIEKMLCHQMAAAHGAGMELLGHLRDSRRLPPAEAARLANAASRLFETVQTGATCLQRLKTGGTQQVLVQYQQQVNVETGGRAMVAATLPPGGARRRRLKNAK